MNKLFNKIINVSEFNKLNNVSQKKVVFTNGCFDILHKGHIIYLNKSKLLGDILVIGLNTDNSVKRIKGESRPVNNQYDRAIVLAGLYCVDYIIFFDEDTPYNLIKSVNPDILVKGGDYNTAEIVGADIVIKNGGIVKTIDFEHGYSTTDIISKMQT